MFVYAYRHNRKSGCQLVEIFFQGQLKILIDLVEHVNVHFLQGVCAAELVELVVHFVENQWLVIVLSWVLLTRVNIEVV